MALNFKELRRVVVNVRGADADMTLRSVFLHGVHGWRLQKELLPMPAGNTPKQEEFLDSHQKAWMETFNNLQSWKTHSIDLSLPTEGRLLIVGWHFPEVAKLVIAGKSRDVLCLMAGESCWLDALKETGLPIIDLRAAEATHQVVEQMQAGRRIFAMLDIVYADTENVLSPFFDRPARTPSRLLNLAIDNHYTVMILGPRESKVEIVASIKAVGLQVSQLADWVNHVVEQEIRQSPHRWLMWGNLSSRFKTA